MGQLQNAEVCEHSMTVFPLSVYPIFGYSNDGISATNIFFLRGNTYRWSSSVGWSADDWTNYDLSLVVYSFRTCSSGWSRKIEASTLLLISQYGDDQNLWEIPGWSTRFEHCNVSSRTEVKKALSTKRLSTTSTLTEWRIRRVRFADQHVIDIDEHNGIIVMTKKCSRIAWERHLQYTPHRQIVLHARTVSFRSCTTVQLEIGLNPIWSREFGGLRTMLGRETDSMADANHRGDPVPCLLRDTLSCDSKHGNLHWVTFCFTFWWSWLGIDVLHL